MANVTNVELGDYMLVLEDFDEQTGEVFDNEIQITLQVTDRCQAYESEVEQVQSLYDAEPFQIEAFREENQLMTVDFSELFATSK